ncbi:MAG: hypothetical protein ACFB20_10945 [Opitutales bacterium]
MIHHHPRRTVDKRLLGSMFFSGIIVACMLVVLGGLTIFHSVYIEEPEFKAPPPKDTPPPPPPVLEQSVAQKQKQSARPVPRVTPNVKNQIDLPDITIPVTNIDMKVAVGLGNGAGRGAGAFGSANIDINSSPVDFFGLKGRGERIVFLIDAGAYMMDDKKGGLYAYRIIKEEVQEQIGGLKPGTLFNVILFQKWGKQLNLFSPGMVPATAANKEKLATWFAPINATANRLGTQGSNYALKHPIEPIGDGSHGVYHALHAGFELGTDAIFVFAGGWANQMQVPLPDGFNMDEFRRSKGWNAEKQQEWQKAVQRAQEWLRKENAARKARGQPPRVNNNIRLILRDILKDPTEHPPDPPRTNWDIEALIQHFRALAEVFYKKENFSDPIERPSVNVVVFRGKDEGWNEQNDAAVQSFVSRNKGKRKLLEGLAGVELATGRSQEERPANLNRPNS